MYRIARIEVWSFWWKQILYTSDKVTKSTLNLIFFAHSSCCSLCRCRYHRSSSIFSIVIGRKLLHGLITAVGETDRLLRQAQSIMCSEWWKQQCSGVIVVRQLVFYIANNIRQTTVLVNKLFLSCLCNTWSNARVSNLRLLLWLHRLYVFSELCRWASDRYLAPLSIHRYWLRFRFH